MPEYFYRGELQSGKDGNAFAILGRCHKAAKAAQLSDTEIQKFMEEAKSGDYDNLLKTVCEWFFAQ